MRYGTAEELAALLHTRVTVENAPLLLRCLDAASEEIDADLNRLEPWPAEVPETVHSVALSRAVEWYKSADAAFGVIGYSDTGALTQPKDAFNRYRTVIAPYKQAWGFA